MGDNADDIFQSFELSVDNQKVYKTVKEKFNLYFVKRRDVIYERAVFNRRKQENEESVETFITALYSLTEHCNYSNLREEMIRDRMVVGVRDSTVIEATAKRDTNARQSRHPSEGGRNDQEATATRTWWAERGHRECECNIKKGVQVKAKERFTDQEK